MNRTHLLPVMFLIVGLQMFSCKRPSVNDAKPIYQLVERILPGQSPGFTFDTLMASSYCSAFRISTKDGLICIAGTDTNAMAKGFYYYVQHYLKGNISRNGSQIPIINKLPTPDKPVFKGTKLPYRYYLNYCTYNYSMSFWIWDDWEKEIDWMAMHGINMPLAIIGTEAVWQNTLRQFGFTEKEIFAFIPGPAYTAWWLMDNLEGWGGPVSQQWIDSRVVLQQKILTRMRELGMQPVLPAFYGMVPNAMIEKFPNNTIFKDGEWAGHQRPAFVDPTDSLFAKMAKVFYTEQEKLYGKSLFYSGDPFHEGGKKMGDLTASARAIQTAMQLHSPQSTWILQGWQESPTDALLAGTDSTYTLVMDMFGEEAPIYAKRNSFGGRNFLWCNINNFGNNTYMYANFDSIIQVPIALQNSVYKKHFKGIGLCPEGILTDPMVYDLFFDMAWADHHFDLNQWLTEYTTSRYGVANTNLSYALKLLGNSVYNAPHRTENVLCARPSIEADRTTSWGPGISPAYSNDSLLKAINLMLQVSDTSITNKATYRFDLANCARQAVTSLAYNKLQALRLSFETKKVDLFREQTKDFLDLILSLDTLVSQMPGFSFYQWQQDAIALGTDNKEDSLFVWNANRLVSLWANEKGAFWLHDYAYREWYGLLSGYYYPRWDLYFNFLLDKMNGKTTKEPDFYAFEDTWCIKKLEYKEPISLDLNVFVGKLLDF